MERHDVAKILGNACRSLTPAQATELATATVPIGIPAGSFVCRQGDKSDGVLIFVRGSVEISRQTGGAPAHVIATVNAPTVLGEIGLITDRPRSATVRALTGCEFHLLTKQDFKRMLDEEQVAAFKLVGMLAEVLARRLEAADDRLLALMEAASPRAQARAPAPAAASETSAITAPAAPPPAARVVELDALREELFSGLSF